MASEAVERVAAAGQKLLQRVRKQMLRMAQEWIELLALQDYEISIDFETDNPNNRGQCIVSDRYRRAQIAYDANEAVRDPSGLEELVVHELVHVMLWPLGDEISRWMERAGERGFEIDSTERSRVRDVIEASVVRVARGMVAAREEGCRS